MADEDASTADKDAGEPSEEKSGGLKKIIILAVLALVIIGASVGGTITVLSMLKEEAPVDPDAAAVEEVEAPPKPAIYYPLKPEYILNIDGRGRRRFMRLDITVMTRDDDVIAAIELHRASVDNAINLVGGGQVFEEIQTPEGKEFLRLQILQELQSLFEKELEKPGIEQVLFTNFVVQ